MGLSKKLLGVILASFCLTQTGFALAEEGEGSSQSTESSSASEQTPQAPSTWKKNPTPEETQKQMEQMMGPMMGMMMGQMIKGMAKTMAEPEVAENFATFTRQYYLALVNRGFTEEEAMRIVTSHGLPSLAGKS